MKKLNELKMAASRMTGRTGLLLKKHSPEILMVAGVTGIVVSTVMACKATLGAEAIIDEAHEKLEKIKEAKAYVESIVDDENVSVTYDEADHRKDLAIVYVQTGVDFVKLYGPSVVLGVASLSCILGAHGIMKKRNVALMAAYTAVEQSFADYRKRVVEEFGEEKDRLFKNGIKRELVTVDGVDADGKETSTEVESDIYNPSEISQYARFFDEACSQWTKTPEYNLTFLKCQQNYANDLLRARGHIFLNEVYDMLGIPRSQAGAVVGWVAGEGDDYVDFGIFNAASEAARDFVNGYERSILLDFNVGGVIYDQI